MLKGDLSTTPLADVLLSLANDEATGCLHIVREDGEEALVYLKRGLVYAAYVPGRRPQLGARLISSGALMPGALEEALEAQATELQGWRLGELLVHLGYVDRGVVTAFVVEQLREGCYDLSRWPEGRWRFRKNEKTREDVGGACTVPDLLAEVANRGREWELINAAVHGPAAVPTLGAGGLAAAEMTLDQDQWALLCKVDGERTIAELARDCGFTDYEAGRIVYALVTQGLLEVEETVDEDTSDADEPPPSMSSIASALASVLAGPAETVDDEPDEELLEAFEEDVTSFESFDDEPVITTRIGQALVMPLSDDEWAPPEDGGSELSRLLGGAYGAPEPEPADLALPAVPELSLPELDLPPSLEPELPAGLLGEQDSFSESLARVSEALNALLDDAAPAEPQHVIDAGSDGLGWRSDSRLDDELRREVEAAAIREAAAQAARLAETPAEPDADALRAAEELARREADAMLVRDAGAAALREMDETARREARGDAEPAPVWETQSLAELLGMDEPGPAGDSLGALIAAEQDAAARLAEDAGRRAAQADETALREAERAARREAEMADRHDAEAEAEAAREAAEAELAATAAAERLAAEQAEREAAAARDAEEAARREAEEVERLTAAQAEREAAAADEAELLAAEQAEHEAAAARDAEEAGRRAAEEVERLAAEEAEREAAAAREAEAAEAAERQAAEEAARQAAELAAWEAEHAAALEAELAAAELAAQLTVEPAHDLTVELSAQENSAAEEAALLAAELAAAVPQQSAGTDDGLAFGDAAAMLRDIADDSGATAEPDPEPEPAPDEPEPPATRQPLPPQRDADTASLLRELSSLGLDDEPAPVSAPSRPSGSSPRPAPKEAPKKRKGLFGRG